MSYRNNQFYYPVSAGEESIHFGNTDSGIPDASNPPFTYPDSTVRVVDPYSKRPSGLSSSKLQRGYIRSLLTEAQGVQVPLKKCRFQFNPNRLMQTVQMNQSIANFFMLDPAQRAQPLGSEVSFGFELFFDRSYELNNPRGDINTESVWAMSSPSEVGVLRDIATFYEVIGQGISEDMTEYAKAQWTNSLKAEINANQLSEDDEKETLENLSEFTKNMSVNVGNTAFLLPLPVRVLFSSLYMVEGYVTDTSVVYTKFTTSMIPMQATMTVSMKALYIGFAKRDTFTTENIKKTIEVERDIAATAAENLSDKKDAYKGVLEELGKIEYQVEPANVPYPSGQPSTFAQIFEAGKSKLASSLPNGATDGKMMKLFESDIPASVSYILQLKIYGPFDNLGQISSNGAPKTGEVETVGDLIEATAPLITLTSSPTIVSSPNDWRRLVIDGDYGHGVSPTDRLTPDGTLTADKYYTIVVIGSAIFKYGSTQVRGTVLQTVRKGYGASATFFDSEVKGTATVLWDAALTDGTLDDLPPITDSGTLIEDGVVSDVGGEEG